MSVQTLKQRQKKEKIMKHHIGSLVVALVAVLVLATPPSIYAQDQTGSAAAQASTSSSRTLDPTEAAARVATGKPLVDIEARERSAVVAPVVNAQTAVACNMCFTCGGDWPIFAGAVHAVNTGLATFERGSSCSGAIHSSNDTNPFLCCR
jgi:hypothetical protein